MSSDEQLESELKQLFATVTLRFPLSSSRILGRLIANGSSVRLSDISRLESLLSKFAISWEAGSITIRHDIGGISVLHASVTQESGYSPLKRKRSDTDDDSAIKDNPRPYHGLGPPIQLLTADTNLQDVYTLLQKGTARAKLLAEQVIRFVRVVGFWTEL